VLSWSGLVNELPSCVLWYLELPRMEGGLDVLRGVADGICSCWPRCLLLFIEWRCAYRDPATL
jgi:hypothetical protein